MVKGTTGDSRGSGRRSGGCMKRSRTRDGWPRGESTAPCRDAAAPWRVGPASLRDKTGHTASPCCSADLRTFGCEGLQEISRISRKQNTPAQALENASALDRRHRGPPMLCRTDISEAHEALQTTATRPSSKSCGAERLRALRPMLLERTHNGLALSASGRGVQGGGAAADTWHGCMEAGVHERLHQPQAALDG